MQRAGVQNNFVLFEREHKEQTLGLNVKLLLTIKREFPSFMIVEYDIQLIFLKSSRAWNQVEA